MATERTTPTESSMNEVGHFALLSIGVSSMVDHYLYNSFFLLSALDFTWTMKVPLVLV